MKNLKRILISVFALTFCFAVGFMFVACDNDNATSDTSKDVIVDGGGESKEEESSTENTKITITFDANGGRLAVKPIETTQNENVKLPTSGVTRDGYEFVGWSSNKNAGTGSYTYKTSTYNVTLFAIWANYKTITYVVEEDGSTFVAEAKYNKDTYNLKVVDSLARSSKMITGYKVYNKVDYLNNKQTTKFEICGPGTDIEISESVIIVPIYQDITSYPFSFTNGVSEQVVMQTYYDEEYDGLNGMNNVAIEKLFAEEAGEEVVKKNIDEISLGDKFYIPSIENAVILDEYGNIKNIFVGYKMTYVLSSGKSYSNLYDLYVGMNRSTAELPHAKSFYYDNYKSLYYPGTLFDSSILPNGVRAILSPVYIDAEKASNIASIDSNNTVVQGMGDSVMILPSNESATKFNLNGNDLLRVLFVQGNITEKSYIVGQNISSIIYMGGDVVDLEFMGNIPNSNDINIVIYVNDEDYEATAGSLTINILGTEFHAGKTTAGVRRVYIDVLPISVLGIGDVEIDTEPKSLYLYADPSWTPSDPIDEDNLFLIGNDYNARSIISLSNVVALFNQACIDMGMPSEQIPTISHFMFYEGTNPGVQKSPNETIYGISADSYLVTVFSENPDPGPGPGPGPTPPGPGPNPPTTSYSVQVIGYEYGGVLTSYSNLSMNNFINNNVFDVESATSFANGMYSLMNMEVSSYSVYADYNRQMYMTSIDPDKQSSITLMMNVYIVINLVDSQPPAGAVTIYIDFNVPGMESEQYQQGETIYIGSQINLGEIADYIDNRLSTTYGYESYGVSSFYYGSTSQDVIDKKNSTDRSSIYTVTSENLFLQPVYDSSYYQFASINVMDTNNIANTQGSWRSRNSHVKISEILSSLYSSYLGNIEYVEVREGSYSGSVIETIYPNYFENAIIDLTNINGTPYVFVHMTNGGGNDDLQTTQYNLYVDGLNVGTYDENTDIPLSNIISNMSDSDYSHISSIFVTINGNSTTYTQGNDKFNFYCTFVMTGDAYVVFNYYPRVYVYSNGIATGTVIAHTNGAVYSDLYWFVYSSGIDSTYITSVSLTTISGSAYSYGGTEYTNLSLDYVYNNKPSVEMNQDYKLYITVSGVPHYLYYCVGSGNSYTQYTGSTFSTAQSFKDLVDIIIYVTNINVNDMSNISAMYEQNGNTVAYSSTYDSIDDKTFVQFNTDVYIYMDYGQQAQYSSLYYRINGNEYTKFGNYSSSDTQNLQDLLSNTYGTAGYGPVSALTLVEVRYGSDNTAASISLTSDNEGTCYEKAANYTIDFNQDVYLYMSDSGSTPQQNYDLYYNMNNSGYSSFGQYSSSQNLQTLLGNIAGSMAIDASGITNIFVTYGDSNNNPSIFVSDYSSATSYTIDFNQAVYISFTYTEPQQITYSALLSVAVDNKGDFIAEVNSSLNDYTSNNVVNFADVTSYIESNSETLFGKSMIVMGYEIYADDEFNDYTTELFKNDSYHMWQDVYVIVILKVDTSSYPYAIFIHYPDNSTETYPDLRLTNDDSVDLEGITDYIDEQMMKNGYPTYGVNGYTYTIKQGAEQTTSSRKEYIENISGDLDLYPTFDENFYTLIGVYVKNAETGEMNNINVRSNQKIDIDYLLTDVYVGTAANVTLVEVREGSYSGNIIYKTARAMETFDYSVEAYSDIYVIFYTSTVYYVTVETSEDNGQNYSYVNQLSYAADTTLIDIITEVNIDTNTISYVCLYDDSYSTTYYDSLMVEDLNNKNVSMVRNYVLRIVLVYQDPYQTYNLYYKVQDQESYSNYSSMSGSYSLSNLAEWTYGNAGYGPLEGLTRVEVRYGSENAEPSIVLVNDNAGTCYEKLFSTTANFTSDVYIYFHYDVYNITLMLPDGETQSSYSYGNVGSIPSGQSLNLSNVSSYIKEDSNGQSEFNVPYYYFIEFSVGGTLYSENDSFYPSEDVVIVPIVYESQPQITVKVVGDGGQEYTVDSYSFPKYDDVYLINICSFVSDNSTYFTHEEGTKVISFTDQDGNTYKFNYVLIRVTSDIVLTPTFGTRDMYDIRIVYEQESIDYTYATLEDGEYFYIKDIFDFIDNNWDIPEGYGLVDISVMIGGSYYGSTSYGDGSYSVSGEVIIYPNIQPLSYYTATFTYNGNTIYTTQVRADRRYLNFGPLEEYIKANNPSLFENEFMGTRYFIDENQNYYSADVNDNLYSDKTYEVVIENMYKPVIYVTRNTTEGTQNVENAFEYQSYGSSYNFSLSGLLSSLGYNYNDGLGRFMCVDFVKYRFSTEDEWITVDGTDINTQSLPITVTSRNIYVYVEDGAEIYLNTGYDNIFAGFYWGTFTIYDLMEALEIESISQITNISHNSVDTTENFENFTLSIDSLTDYHIHVTYEELVGYNLYMQVSDGSSSLVESKINSFVLEEVVLSQMENLSSVQNSIVSLTVCETTYDIEDDVLSHIDMTDPENPVVTTETTINLSSDTTIVVNLYSGYKVYRVNSTYKYGDSVDPRTALPFSNVKTRKFSFAYFDEKHISYDYFILYDQDHTEGIQIQHDPLNPTTINITCDTYVQVVYNDQVVYPQATANISHSIWVEDHYELEEDTNYKVDMYTELDLADLIAYANNVIQSWLPENQEVGMIMITIMNDYDNTSFFHDYWEREDFDNIRVKNPIVAGNLISVSYGIRIYYPVTIVYNGQENDTNFGRYGQGDNINLSSIKSYVENLNWTPENYELTGLSIKIGTAQAVEYTDFTAQGPVANDDIVVTPIFTPITHTVTITYNESTDTSYPAVNQGTNLDLVAVGTYIVATLDWVPNGYELTGLSISVNGGQAQDYTDVTAEGPVVTGAVVVTPIFTEAQQAQTYSAYLVTDDYTYGDSIVTEGENINAQLLTSDLEADDDFDLALVLAEYNNQKDENDPNIGYFIIYDSNNQSGTQVATDAVVSISGDLCIKAVFVYNLYLFVDDGKNEYPDDRTLLQSGISSFVFEEVLISQMAELGEAMEDVTYLEIGETKYFIENIIGTNIDMTDPQNPVAITTTTITMTGDLTIFVVFGD